MVKPQAKGGKNVLKILAVFGQGHLMFSLLLFYTFWAFDGRNCSLW